MLGHVDGLALRQLRTRRLRSVLTASAVALGVGMMLGVLLLSATIRATFDDLVDSAWGTTDVVLTPHDSSGVIPADTLDTVRGTPGVASAAPMVGVVLTRLHADGTAITGSAGELWVAGYDPRNPSYDFERVAGRAPVGPDDAFVEQNWARQRGVDLGDRIAVAAPTGPARLRVTGVFRFSSGLSFGGPGMVGVTIPTARQLANVPRGWHQISVRATDRSQAEALVTSLERRLGRGIDVRTPRQVSGDIKEQLQALDIVLLLFGGMAMFIGGFLILNAFTMTVMQRTRELGMLRTLGADRRLVARTVLTEALVLACIGVVAGIGLGIGVADGLIALLRSLDVPVSDLTVSPGLVVVAAVAGLASTLVGAVLPARRAARTSPVRAVQGGATQDRSRPSWRRLVVALALFLPGFLFGGDYWFGAGNSGSALAGAIGLLGTMAMFAGMVVVAPFIVPPIIAALAVPLRRVLPVSGRLAADATRTSRRRTSATAISLGVALSVIVVNAAMAATFMQTISHQMTDGFARDLTVRPTGAGLEEAGSRLVPAALTEAIAALPQSGTVTGLRVTAMDLPGLDGQSTGLVEGVDPVAWQRVDRSRMSGATHAQAMRALATDGAVVGAPYAKRADLHVGDPLRLSGGRSTVRLRIAAIQQTVSEYQGQVVLVSHATLARMSGVTQDAQVIVAARSPDDRKALDAAVQGLLRQYPGVEALSTSALREDIDKEISNQFAMFNAIVAVAVLAGLLGVVNTLAMSVLERTRELGVLRALGASRLQVRMTMVCEALLITVAGAGVGLAFGLPIAWIWSRGLGDMLPGAVFAIPVSAVLAIAVAGVVLGGLAAILPARRAARMDVAAALAAE